MIKLIMLYCFIYIFGKIWIYYSEAFPQIQNLIIIFFFSNYRKQVPVLYDGDLHQHDKIITWLTSQDVFEIKNEIEEVNRKMLDKLLEENEFITVFFCKYLN